MVTVTFLVDDWEASGTNNPPCLSAAILVWLQIVLTEGPILSQLLG